MTSTIVHIVLFKFRQNADPAKVAKAIQDFNGMKTYINYIKNVRAGQDFTIARAKGFSHALVVELNNKEDLKRYDTDAHHVSLKNANKELVEDTLCVDFEI